MNKQTVTWTGIGATCAACCVPLLLPLVGSAGLVGASVAGAAALLALPLDLIICGSIAISLAAAGLVLAIRRRSTIRPVLCNCETACNVHPHAPHSD